MPILFNGPSWDAGIDPTGRNWFLLGDMPGDNAQIALIVRTLNWPFVRKRPVFKTRDLRPLHGFCVPRRRVHVDASQKLAPPWPDLILTSGGHPSIAALRVKEQSGGRTKLVVIGRPPRNLQDFDLVIVPTHADVPTLPNILKLNVPLREFNREDLTDAVEVWKNYFEALPRPLTVLVIGGSRHPFRLNERIVSRVVAKASKLSTDGTLIVVPSRHTPDPVRMALPAILPPNVKFFAWTPNLLSNPYFALLGIADRFIVTGDNISMMMEIAAIGQPLAIAPLPLSRAPWIQLAQVLERYWGGAGARELGFWSWSKQMLHESGFGPFAHDLNGFHSYLLEQGMAVRLGDPFPLHPAPFPDGLDQSVARIRSLMGKELATDGETL